jgi:hypothetical protein
MAQNFSGGLMATSFEKWLALLAVIAALIAAIILSNLVRLV